MSGDLLISVSPGEAWAALVENEELVALDMERAGGRGRPGEVVLGRVVELRPDLPAALIDIGLDRPGFLSGEDAEPGTGIANLNEGQDVMVQIVKSARADKAAGLTMRLRLSGRLLHFLPSRPGISVDKGLAPAEREQIAALVSAIVRPGEGIQVQATASGATAVSIAADLEALRQRWQAIETAAHGGEPPALLEAPISPVAALLTEFCPAMPSAIVIDDRLAFAEARNWLSRNYPHFLERLAFHREATGLYEYYGIENDIAAVLEPRVDLPGGGKLTIQTVAAATLIDVDSGDGRRRGSAAEAILATNLASTQVIARQIRLRNLAGPVVIDFVGMKSRRDRDRVQAALAAALGEGADTDVLGWTRLGHLELVRKRRRAPLVERLFEQSRSGSLVKTPVTVALEGLRRLAREVDAKPGRTPTLFVHPEVAAAFERDASEALLSLEARLGRNIGIVAEPGRARDVFDIRLD